MINNYIEIFKINISQWEVNLFNVDKNIVRIIGNSCIKIKIRN